MSTTAIITEIRERLGVAGVQAFVAPVDKAPLDGGRVAPFVAIWATSGRDRVRADSVARVDKVESFQLTVAAASSYECLAAVERVRAALTGVRLTCTAGGSGRLYESGYNNIIPSVEVGTDPVRVSLPLQYNVISK